MPVPVMRNPLLCGTRSVHCLVPDRDRVVVAPLAVIAIATRDASASRPCLALALRPKGRDAIESRPYLALALRPRARSGGVPLVHADHRTEVEAQARTGREAKAGTDGVAVERGIDAVVAEAERDAAAGTGRGRDHVMRTLIRIVMDIDTPVVEDQVGRTETANRLEDIETRGVVVVTGMTRVGVATRRKTR